MLWIWTSIALKWRNASDSSYKLHRFSCGTQWHQISTRPNGSWIQFAIKFSLAGGQIRWFDQTSVSDWRLLQRQSSDTIQYPALPNYIAHLRQQCHNSKLVIFQEKHLKVLKCCTFLWVQWWHSCSPAAGFTNCVMALYLLKMDLQTFLSIPITQKCLILSCDTIVTNERYVSARLVKNFTVICFEITCTVLPCHV